MIKVYHFNSLTESERMRLNSSDGGWDSEPKFSRYADITTGFSKRFIPQVLMAIALGEYTAVAEVAAHDLDWAYRSTNHIEVSWTENENVTALLEEVRSTSVGDIMEKDGEFYVVASMGFTKLDIDNMEPVAA